MTAKFKKGDAIQQVIPNQIKGSVIGFHADTETGHLQVLVGWTDADGAEASRYFDQDQIEPLAE